MRDYKAYQREAFRYWERHRLWHNLTLVLPAMLGYGPSVLSAAVGDRPQLGSLEVLGLFVLSAFGANVCFSFAYAIEFVFSTDDPASRWQRLGRPLVFVSGTLFAMVLAFFGGRSIHVIEYSTYYR